MTNTKISLSDVTQELAKQCNSTLSYKRLYRAVLDGELIAEKEANRWMFDRSQLPQIARHFGLERS